MVIRAVSTEEIIALNLPSGLSLPDRTALCLTLRENGRLLSGDGLVRRTAQQMDIQVYGLLWLFDKLIENEVITPKTALSKLTFLVKEKGSRQPKSEYEHRVERWKNQ